VGKTASTQKGPSGGFIGKNPFTLPRSVHHHLKKCVETHAQEKRDEAGYVEYLWIDISDEKLAASKKKRRAATTLGLDEWLNVIDEAATLGVHCVLVHVGDSFSAYPDVWAICEWAQRTHGMMVGLHVHSRSFSEADLRQLRRLDLAKACLFVDGAAYENMGNLRTAGIPLCAADVTEADCSAPCDMPECMVYVGAEGRLYSCGLVVGQKNYCLGSVLESRLDRVVRDAARPRTVSERPPGNDCNGCPPIMAKRAREARS
jgi:radical SAM protein with 4Fe4S-binding SPASM domain